MAKKPINKPASKQLATGKAWEGNADKLAENAHTSYVPHSTSVLIPDSQGGGNNISISVDIPVPTGREIKQMKALWTWVKLVIETDIKRQHMPENASVLILGTGKEYLKGAGKVEIVQTDDFNLYLDDPEPFDYVISLDGLSKLGDRLDDVLMMTPLRVLIGASYEHFQEIGFSVCPPNEFVYQNERADISNQSNKPALPSWILGVWTQSPLIGIDPATRIK